MVCTVLWDIQHWYGLCTLCGLYWLDKCICNVKVAPKAQVGELMRFGTPPCTARWRWDQRRLPLIPKTQECSSLRIPILCPPRAEWVNIDQNYIKLCPHCEEFQSEAEKYADCCALRAGLIVWDVSDAPQTNNYGALVLEHISKGPKQLPCSTDCKPPSHLPICSMDPSCDVRGPVVAAPPLLRKSFFF